MSNAVQPRSTVTTVTFVLICLIFALIQDPPRLEFDRIEILSGQIWRLWTGHLIHFSWAHIFLDVVTFLIVCGVTEKECGSRFTFLVIILGMPLMSVVLLLVTPDLVQYRGISGVTTLLAFVSATTIWHSQPMFRIVLTILGMAFIGKTMIDISDLSPIFSTLPIGIQVVWQAHLIGALMGWCVGHTRLMVKAPRSVDLKPK